MKYQKPKVVAKSAPKQSFVAGCPPKVSGGDRCLLMNRNCQVGKVD